MHPLRRLGLLAAGVALLGGCYSFAQPSFHPGNARQLLTAVARRLESATTMVGDSACADRSLIENAIHIRARASDDPQERDVWIYAFREKGWDKTKDAVDACQAEYAAANPGSEITRVDIPIYRAFGADWSPGLIAAVKDGLEEASTMGVPGQ